ncbi:MAG TPA: serine/threonine-protein kinase, partial [Thermoanaerobaculia bacterium]|nr:serine/threonine-protein kinase [Thermoanaerobaculia bacterium]
MTPSPLSPGIRLGSYEIIAALGAGGMGEVYRARDTRLGREVAIKVLARRLMGDPKAQARFEREARAVAALSHPNVMALFDYGESDGTTFAVLELLEGETLRARLAAGALAQRKAIEYAVQIVRGLSAAHEQGIVHRDLKPENVFLTRSGQVKILDFGLAFLTASAPGLLDGPTLLTEPGIVMGTAGYMSPEQVRGQQADERSDLFSFGAILYEMLAGRQAFPGETASDRMTAILHKEPPDLPASVPPALDRIVRHCLEKRREERFRSAHDLAFDLEALASTGDSRGAPPPAARSGRRLAPALLAVLLLAAGAGLAKWLWRDPSPSAPAFRQLTFRLGTIFTARFAPDGDTIVYGAAWEGASSRIFTVRADRPESVPLALPSADLLAVSKSGDIALSLGRSFLSSPFSSRG